MNLSEHVRVTAALHVELSVVDRPELTRVIGVPCDAPSYWVVEAYRLSLGLEPEPEPEPEPETETPEFEGDTALLIDLMRWRSETQQVAIPGVAEAVDVAIRGPFETRMGEPRVTVVVGGGAETGEQTDSAGWQVGRPPFRAEHVAVELARRFGLVQAYFDPSLDLGDGLYPSSPIAALSESLTPVRRLALHAHLEERGLIEARPPDPADAESATAGLRALVAHIGPEGVEQDPADGWIPRETVAETVEALGWPEAVPPDLPDPAETLVVLARRTKAIRRLRGRVVVTHRGHSLAAGEACALFRIVEVVREIGREGRLPSGLPRKATLALLAIADGSAATFDELPELVALGEAAVATGRDGAERFTEWSPRSYRAQDREEGGLDDRHAVQRVQEILCALSSPGAFGAITPAMRAVARAALR